MADPANPTATMPADPITSLALEHERLEAMNQELTRYLDRCINDLRASFYTRFPDYIRAAYRDGLRDGFAQGIMAAHQELNHGRRTSKPDSDSAA